MSEAVVERKDDEHLVCRLYSNHRVSLLNVCSVVSVSKKDSLRICGRSGSVADVGVIIRSDRLVSLYEKFLVFCKELVSESDDIIDKDFILLHILHLIEKNHLFHHRALRKDLSDLRKLEL